MNYTNHVSRIVAPERRPGKGLPMETGILNKSSRRVTQPKSQGASQAMLCGTGLTEAEMDKPQVGIAAAWYQGNTCNMHLNDMAVRVKKGVTAAGMVGMRFNTIGVSDGGSMGTEGMSYSRQSRDLIAFGTLSSRFTFAGAFQATSSHI